MITSRLEGNAQENTIRKYKIVISVVLDLKNKLLGIVREVCLSNVCYCKMVSVDPGWAVGHQDLLLINKKTRVVFGTICFPTAPSGE